MKRKLTLVVCVIATLAMIFTLASCGGSDHTHTYAQEWSSNDYGHWYAATCGCEGETANYGAHVDADKNGVCDTCAYVTCTHEYETEWQSDETHHWNNSSCGCNVKGSYGEHIDDDKNGICDTCEYVMCEHEYETEWSSDGENHWHAPTCGCDVDNADVAKHVDTVFDGVCDVCGAVICAHADDDKDGICDNCTYVMCTHEFAKTWKTDEKGHWHEATCGCNVTDGYALHEDKVGGENGGKDGKCDVCEYVLCTHEFASKYSKNSTKAYHWFDATCGCDVVKGKEEHTDTDKDGICEVCNMESCEHTYAAEWTSDATGHWHAATCGCEIKGDFAAHTPVVGETSSACGVCEFVICAEHTYNNFYNAITEEHWFEASCGCDTVSGKANHADDNKDGLCDECAWTVCEHEFAAELSSNETSHWYNATCGCYVNNGKADHVDEDEDGVCDTCTFKSAVKDTVDSLDSEASLNTNSTESIKDKGATSSYDSSYTYEVLEDGRLSLYNEWGDMQFMYITLTDGVPTLIDDVYGNGEKALTPVDGEDGAYYYTKGIYTYIIRIDDTSNIVNIETAWSAEKNSYYKVYDNYIVVSDIYGNVKYYSYYGENGKLLFVMTVDEYGNINRETDTAEPDSIASYSAVNWNVSASNHEDFIKGLYNLGVNGTTDWEGNVYPSYGFVGAENEGVYSFSYLFVEGYSCFVVEASFTVDAETKGITAANVTIKQYSDSDVTLNAGADTYVVADEAEATSSETYEITQAFGDPMDSTSNPNPHPAANYIVDEYTITYNGEVVNNGDTIEADATESVELNFGEDVLDIIKYNTITVSATYGEGTELPSYWNTIGSITVNEYNDARPITFTGKVADTFVITIDVEGIVTTLTIKVNYLTPESINSVVYDEDDNKVTTDNYTIYMGQSLKITSSVAAGCNPAYTATLPAGAAAAIKDNENGTWTFTPVMTGDFEITLTSAADANVSTVLNVTVAEPPAISDVLSGEHTGSNMYSGLTVGATFTPSEEGATTGNVVVTVNGEMFSYATWGWETIEYSATYTYAYNDETGAIELTYVEGDEFTVELNVVNYKIVAIYEFNEYKLVQKVVEVPAGDPTESPITVTMTGAYTYCYEYTFTFVAGEAGFYQFTVPSGFGIFSEAEYQNYGQAYVDFNANGGTFVLELEAGQVLNWRFGSLEAIEYSVEFEYSATGFENTTETYVVVNENATPSEITVTVDPNGTITFAFVHPMTGMSTSAIYEYELVDGVMTLSFAGNLVEAEEASVTLVDGKVTAIVYFGNEYLAQAENETINVSGNYVATNEFGNTISVVITDETVTFSYTHPMTGMPFEAQYEYEIVDGAMVLSQGGVAVDAAQAAVTLTDGVPTGASLNGTTYTLAKAE
ncbi:MAG: hypothetical protein IJ437_05955 [Clostridia bacterium]|nr:hypothetical protein [Clostridia bacterium]